MMRGTWRVTRSIESSLAAAAEILAPLPEGQTQPLDRRRTTCPPQLD